MKKEEKKIKSIEKNEELTPEELEEQKGGHCQCKLGVLKVEAIKKDETEL